MGYEQVIPLPERSIGRSGRDLFLSHKDVTIIMVPYERYSVFPKAVDALYRSVEIPFNLIVVEGNAPEPVRLSLEKRQCRHGNMTIIYTNHYPSLANAFNLAMPHFKTPYALLMDNEMRLPKGAVTSFLETARATGASVICPKNSRVRRMVRSNRGDGRQVSQGLESPGLRPSFMISHEAVRDLGKIFDEFSSLYTLGIDFLLKAQSKGHRVSEAPQALMETCVETALRSTDMPLFRTQWNRDRLFQSLDHLEKKWGVQLADDRVYWLWLQSKLDQADRATGLDRVFSRLFSRVRENGWKRMQDVVTHLRGFSLAKNSYATKVNVSKVS